MQELKEKVLHWLIHGEKGISSKAMASAVICEQPDRTWASFGNHPSDPADLNRCLKFLSMVPEARQHIDKVAALSDQWGKLIARWDEVEQCFLDEVGFNWCNGKSAPKTFALMKEIGC